MSAPDIFVSDLYLPPPTGDSVPTDAQRNEAAEHARKVADRFSLLYSHPLDDKARRQEPMKAIGDAYAMLALQWTVLGQSPDHGVALLAKVQAQHPDVPFVFYSRKNHARGCYPCPPSGCGGRLQKKCAQGRGRAVSAGCCARFLSRGRCAKNKGTRLQCKHHSPPRPLTGESEALMRDSEEHNGNPKTNA